MRKQLSPWGAVWRGLMAGAAGAAVQNFFFRATGKWAPTSPREAFVPPEPEQASETATQTMARRAAELAGRGPLTEDQKRRGSAIVHYAFGSLWGAAYGLTRESVAALGRPAGVLGYATNVWFTSDNVLLPLFRLGAWPNRYPAAVHGYAWLAHVAYAAGVAASYALLRRMAVAPLAVTGWMLLGKARLRRRLPRALRPGADAALDAIIPVLRSAARWKGSAVRI